MKAEPGCGLYGPSVSFGARRINDGRGEIMLNISQPTAAAFGTYADDQLDGAAIVFQAGPGGSHLAVLCIVARSTTPEDAAAAVLQGAAHVAGELLYSASQIGGDDAADE